ncbi:MAG TPA: SDR family NAD(P)-dependent oxidoreductase [Acidimicrobiales bacterium]|nr:SDR family NAD(P)-dependent oxidoreductase [Acidimicrobiales bacterium]
MTGASKGLGRGLVEAFQAAGHRVAACARTTPDLGDLTASVDVSDGPAVHGFARRVVDELGPIRLWISNAGVLDPIAPARSVDPAAFLRSVEINLLGVLHGAQAFLATGPVPDSCLVNISSGAALRGYAGWAAYCAGKAGVDRLTEVLALEEPGLRIHAVAPGIVDTDMQAAIRASDPEVFPLVERFRGYKADEAYNSPEWVARQLVDLTFGPRDDRVVIRIPDERTT